jgi:hypothetical protein
MNSPMMERAMASDTSLSISIESLAGQFPWAALAYATPSEPCSTCTDDDDEDDDEEEEEEDD